MHFQKGYTSCSRPPAHILSFAELIDKVWLAGYIHRDVTLYNIILDDQDKVNLIDWSTSKQVKEGIKAGIDALVESYEEMRDLSAPSMA